MLNTAYINLYVYETGRLHAGTGVYPSYEIARDIAKHKSNYLQTVKIKGIPNYLKVSPDKGGFFRIFNENLEDKNAS